MVGPSFKWQKDRPGPIALPPVGGFHTRPSVHDEEEDLTDGLDQGRCCRGFLGPRWLALPISHDHGGLLWKQAPELDRFTRIQPHPETPGTGVHPTSIRLHRHAAGPAIRARKAIAGGGQGRLQCAAAGFRQHTVHGRSGNPEAVALLAAEVSDAALVVAGEDPMVVRAVAHEWKLVGQRQKATPGHHPAGRPHLGGSLFPELVDGLQRVQVPPGSPL